MNLHQTVKRTNLSVFFDKFFSQFFSKIICTLQSLKNQKGKFALIRKFLTKSLLIKLFNDIFMEGLVDKSLFNSVFFSNKPN